MKNFNLKEIILNRLNEPVNYSVCFMGDSCYHGGQMWGTNRVEISQSKTTISIVMQKGGDVHTFKEIHFIRSLNELRQHIEILESECTLFFKNFGKVKIYN